MGPAQEPARPDARRDTRLEALRHWLANLAPRYDFDLESLAPASSDASFRRYFRVNAKAPAHGTAIIMDAPPDREDCAPFIRVAEYLAAGGVSVPRVESSALDQGFLLLSDLGSTTYLAALNPDNADRLYRDATAALIRIQLLPDVTWLPRYDRARLRAELELFPQWYVGRHLGRTLEPAQQQALHGVFDRLIERHQAELQVTVHRDYHSRNLMVQDIAGRSGVAANPGVLDFQDAVRGPASYDLVSLLRDAYIEWPEERVLDWTVRFWEKARRAGVALPDDFGDFWIDFEYMGLQRHLKVLGIFARLHHRDGKDAYLKDLPLVRRYARSVAGRYKALAPLARLLDQLEGTVVSARYTF
jgi:aminoglycoside/choline kinase family phosphotransferase